MYAPDFNDLNEFGHVNKTSVFVDLDLKYLVCADNKENLEFLG